MSDFLYFLRQVFFPNRKSREEIEGDGDPNRLALRLETVWRKLRSGLSVGTAISLLVHAVLLLLLSLFLLPIPPKGEGIDLLGGFSLPKALTETPRKPEGDVKGPDVPKPEDSDPAPEDKAEEIAKTRTSPAEHVPEPQPDEGKPLGETGTAPPGGPPDRKTGELVGGGGYEGRNPEGRGRALGNGDSGGSGERAVEAALEWIAAHQDQKDGGWSFAFEHSCKTCSAGGTHGSRIAATALAILPFLGAGYTHEVGPYKKTVEDGLYFLLVRAVDGRRGADLQQGTEGMYSHGIATIALCEAYAMSRRKPKLLGEKAQSALRFIENAQDRHSGGWRYRPNESPGDLSVSAWQIMALKSGKLAGLHVSQPVVYLSNEFLESVAMDGGRKYNYLPDHSRRGTGEDSPATCSATGLLLRMYLGWEPGDRMLDEGIEAVGRPGPLKSGGTQCNLYFAYYATLAMHHYDGSSWRRWNPTIREFLVRTQSKHGHESGSWYFPDSYCDKGGRLLNTSLATMILETPYRIMPLFRTPGTP